MTSVSNEGERPPLHITSVTRRQSARNNQPEPFDSLVSAAQHIADNRSSTHEVLFRTEQPFSTQLLGSTHGYDQEILLVEAMGRKGVSPSRVSGHHLISTDYINYFHLTLSVTNYSHPILLNGCAFFLPDCPPIIRRDITHLKYGINPGTIGNANEILAEMVIINTRCWKILNDLLEGSVEIR